MNMNDVPQLESPSLVPVPTSTKRLTIQHFATLRSGIVPLYAKHNQDARPPADWSTWPPPIILDALYGNAALKRWASTETTLDLIDSSSKDNYYKQSPEEKTKKAAERRHRAEIRLKKRRERWDEFDVLFVLSLMHCQLKYPLEPPSPPLPTRTRSPENDSIAKVEQWLQTMQSDSST